MKDRFQRFQIQIWNDRVEYFDRVNPLGLHQGHDRYGRVGVLNYATLKAEFDARYSTQVLAEALADVREMQAKRGDWFFTGSGTGGSEVRLGESLADGSPLPPIRFFLPEGRDLSRRVLTCIERTLDEGEIEVATAMVNDDEFPLGTFELDTLIEQSSVARSTAFMAALLDRLDVTERSGHTRSRATHRTTPMTVALQLAARIGDEAMMTLLVERGVSVSARDDWALRAALDHGQMESAQWLLARGADPNAGWEAAVRQDSDDAIQLLLDHDADVPSPLRSQLGEVALERIENIRQRASMSVPGCA